MAEFKRRPLKKCYFCEKEKAEVVNFGLAGRFFVKCCNCGASGPLKDTEFEAIEAWNKDGFYSMTELKPCKCKNPKEPEYFVKRWRDCVEHIYVCPKCKHFGTGFTEQQAIDAWNKRS